MPIRSFFSLSIIILFLFFFFLLVTYETRPRVHWMVIPDAPVISSTTSSVLTTIVFAVNAFRPPPRVPQRCPLKCAPASRLSRAPRRTILYEMPVGAFKSPQKRRENRFGALARRRCRQIIFIVGCKSSSRVYIEFDVNRFFLLIFQLFDMKKFQQNVSRELRRAYPDRRRLECQCLSAISFVKNEADMLESPIWVMIINVVAMDMLKSKLPPSKWRFM